MATARNSRLIRLNRTLRVCALGLISFVALSGVLHAQDVVATITVDRPLVFPDQRDARRQIEDAVLHAIGHVGRQHPELAVRAAWGTAAESGVAENGAGGPRGAYRLSINAIQDNDSHTITLALAGTGGEAAGRQASAIPIMSRWDGDLYREIAQQIYYTWAQAEGFSRFGGADPPVLVDQFSIAELAGSTLSVSGAQLYPYSLAVMPDGGVVVGSITVGVHLGPDFVVRALPGRTLLEQGNFASAMTVAATPAGTIVTRGSMGRELYRYQPGSVEPERIRNPLSGQGGMTVLPDGSVVVTDLTSRRAVRIADRERIPLELFAGEYGYVTALDAGPDGTIWTYDSMTRRIVIFSPDGVVLDSILPIIPMEDAASVKAMSVGERGEVVLLAMNSVWRIDRAGRPVWTLREIADEEVGPISQMMSVAWHEPTGSVWLTDYMGQRVVRLVEEEALSPARLAARPEGGDGSEYRAVTRTILDNGARLAGARTEQERAELYAERGRLYAERGALEMARTQWQRVLDLDPFHPDAFEMLDALEVTLLEREAARVDERVRTLLVDFGRETARQDYSRAIRLYEQILNLDPTNGDARRAKSSLEARFEERDAGAQPRYRLEFANLEVEPLFPVLLDQYRRGEAGQFVIRNAGNGSVEDLEVTAEVPGFSDSPTAVPVPRDVAPGVDVAVDLPLVLSRSVLSLQEDLPVQVVIRAEYTVDGERRSASEVLATTLHRRSALVWDDSGKLASFITPNDDVIAGFALRVLAALEGSGGSPEGIDAPPDATARIAGLSERIVRAIRIADAVGGYGINYVEDPRSPFSQVQGLATAVDTVRFPRTTLFYRSGDCDDTSALLASLYEAAGLDTAIVTTPGHVMIAVDTQEPVSHHWMFESNATSVLDVDGTLWIPVETTVLSRGFAVAWEEGSQLVRRHRDAGEVEVLPVRDLRDRFAALPLPDSSFTITEPPVGVLRGRSAESATQTASILYDTARAVLERERAAAVGSRRVPILNRIGILHARFGAAARAREAFEEALAIRTGYLPAYVNLANLALSENNAEEALRHLEQAELLRPQSPAVIELLARAHFVAGSGGVARDYVRSLAEVAPERAAALAVILPTSGRVAATDGVAASGASAEGRASAAGDPAALLPPSVWLVE